ncbi:nuclease-related domain-containing protein [Nocardia puris]|uniref:Nuclease-like protein n=1 Tax=Nocardia puris TaxID=208602 RepID=A0A366DKK0_9NOCA|nr:nuclease-related domain-containing protein [Nocardia puris]RBO90607.1 nuclease-like protein [Nocardia puris]
MLVKVGSGGQLSGAEQEFVDCLRSFRSTGLLAVGVHAGDNGARRVDAVLFTPRGVAVAEVKGFRRRQSGILKLTDEGPWTISDTAADFDDEDTADPVDRLERSVYAVRTQLERALQNPGHVAGLVALIPFRGVVVRPAHTTVRPGLDVVVANVPDATELRIYTERFASGPRSWSADRVLGAAAALGIEPLSREELIADGFEVLAAHSHLPVAATPQHAPAPPPAPTRKSAVAAWTVFAVACVGIVGVLAVIVSAVAKDTPGSNSDQRSVTTTTADPTPPPAAPRTCYPFQPDC